MQLTDITKTFHLMDKAGRSSVIDAVRLDRQISKQAIVTRTKKQRVKSMDKAAEILEAMTPEERASFFDKVGKR